MCLQGKNEEYVQKVLGGGSSKGSSKLEASSDRRKHKDKDKEVFVQLSVSVI